MFVYKVYVPDMELHLSKSLPQCWAGIHGKLFASEEGAIAAVVQLLHEARPPLTHEGKRDPAGTFILTPNQFVVPKMITINRISVEE